MKIGFHFKTPISFPEIFHQNSALKLFAGLGNHKVYK